MINIGEKLKCLEKMRDFLIQAYKNGLSFEDFRLKTNAYFRSHGFAAPEKSYLSVIFDTNMAGAYMAERIRQMLENVDERPFWRILSSGDDMVRPAHRALHGKIFYYKKIIEKGLIPPFDYSCRCTLSALTAEQIQQMDLKVEKKVLDFYDDPKTGKPVNIRPREGFGHNLGKYDFRILEIEEELFRDIEKKK